MTGEPVRDPDGLNVWHDQQPVGYSWRNPQGLIGFRYGKEWLAQGGFSISCTLPLGHEDFTPEEGLAHHFFANLLPEGDIRARIVRDLKIANTDFDLLKAIGGECAGALSMLQAEHRPSAKCKYREILSHELTDLVARRRRLYAGAASERPRLALSGRQDKCPVLFENGTCWLPKKEAPSSHILKFQSPDHRHSLAYEAFTTLLAGAIGLPVVNIQLQSVVNTHYALIERNDRLRGEGGRIVRLHQEDFCQALGFVHERKYQENGGPAFADCFRLIQDVSSDPANDLQHLLRWQIFNVLAYNSDGHAKNLSLVYQPNGEIRLAPFYDLVCTRAIERIDRRLAFCVGEQKNPLFVSRKDWEAMAQQCGLRPKFLLKLVQDVTGRLLQQLQPVRRTFEQLYGSYLALQRVEQIVTRQCRHTAHRMQD